MVKLDAIRIPINFELDIWSAVIAFAILVGLGIVFMFLLSYYFDIKNKQPELDVLRQCRKKPFPPLVIQADGAGQLTFFAGVKEKKSDVAFNKKDSNGMLLDPAILTKKPRNHLVDGKSVYFYGTDTYFPVDLLGSRAIISIIHQARAEFEVFDWIKDDVVIMELLQKEGDDLLVDCERVLKRFRLDEPIVVLDEELDEDDEQMQRPKVLPIELSYAIEKLKGQLKDRRIENGWFSINEGLDRLPLGTVAGDIKRALQLEAVATQNDQGEVEKKWIIAATVFAIVAGVLILAYMLINAMG